MKFWGGGVAQLIERWLQEAYQAPIWQVRFLTYKTLGVCFCPINCNSKVVHARPRHLPMTSLSLKDCSGYNLNLIYLLCSINSINVNEVTGES